MYASSLNAEKLFNQVKDLPPKTGYTYQVFKCETAGDVQNVYDWGKKQEGFYPYLIPQAEGCIIIVAYKDPEQVVKEKRVELGLTLLTEKEAKNTITEIETCTKTSEVYEDIDTFLTLLYEKGYEIGKRTLKEA